MVPVSLDLHEQQRHFRQPLRSLYNNVELDLDTIFDDDDGINNDFTNNKFSILKPLAVDHVVFDHNFHMVEEPPFGPSLA